jgi:D-alanine--poly(phosphoribitol) ligase subunit 2
MYDKEKVKSIVYQVVDEINENLPAEKKLDKNFDTKLFGKASNLDSLELVNLIVAVEQAVDDEFDKSITLANENALSMDESPFNSLGSLIDYVTLLVNE